MKNILKGIKSAKHAGIRCVAVETSLPRPYLKGADFVIESLAELVKIA